MLCALIIHDMLAVYLPFDVFGVDVMRYKCPVFVSQGYVTQYVNIHKKLKPF